MHKRSFGFGLYEKLLRKLQRDELKELALTLTVKELSLVASVMSAFFESNADEKSRFSAADMQNIMQVLYKMYDEIEKIKRIN